jgi:hypothetical protein
MSPSRPPVRESGVVEARREAKQVFYRISDQRVVVLLATLNQIFCGEMPALTSAVPAPQATPARRTFTEAAMFARVEPGGMTA